MKKNIGGFGWVVLLVVVAVVLLLAARAWESVAPTAAEIRDAAGAIRPDDVHATSESESDDALPGVGQMQRRTSDHASRVADALAAAD